jgi:CPA1 family monovalent cation:H+ antiporter
VDREVRLARVEALRAGAATLGDQADTGATELLRRKYLARLELAEARLNGEGSRADLPSEPVRYAAAARAALAAERSRLTALRSDGTIGDDAFHRVEEELDRAELSVEAMDPDE